MLNFLGTKFFKAKQKFSEPSQIFVFFLKSWFFLVFKAWKALFSDIVQPDMSETYSIGKIRKKYVLPHMSLVYHIKLKLEFISDVGMSENPRGRVVIQAFLRRRVCLYSRQNLGGGTKCPPNPCFHRPWGFLSVCPSISPTNPTWRDRRCRSW